MAGIAERKRERSFVLIDKWNRLGDQGQRSKAIELLADGNISSNEKFRRLSEDLVAKNALMAELYLLEEIALAIERGLVDEPVLIEFFKPMLGVRYKIVREFIDKEREQPNSQDFLKNLTKLAQRWRLIG